MRLRRFPLKGAAPVDWQSQFHGAPGMGLRRTSGGIDACLPWGFAAVQQVVPRSFIMQEAGTTRLLLF